jgi:hypothetical protein
MEYRLIDLWHRRRALGTVVRCVALCHDRGKMLRILWIALRLTPVQLSQCIRYAERHVDDDV